MTLADRLALLPDFARAEDLGLHVAVAERAVASGDADEAAAWAVAEFDLNSADTDHLAAIAYEAIVAAAL
jgi:hypothetical protein